MKYRHTTIAVTALAMLAGLSGPVFDAHARPSTPKKQKVCTIEWHVDNFGQLLGCIVVRPDNQVYGVGYSLGSCAALLKACNKRPFAVEQPDELNELAIDNF